MNLDWYADAICHQTDPEAFFPERGCPTMALAAKRICLRCPVQSQCLEFAMTHTELDGIWGGLSPRERQRLRRPR